MLDNQQIKAITEEQVSRQKQFKAVPKSGTTVSYLDKQFVVFPGVFWPYQDSQPLINNFVIKKGELVLDVGTGSGLIAVFAAYAGAKKVVAVDINTDAVENAKFNAKLHGFNSIIEVRRSDIFSALNCREKFDVITANLPFRDKKARDRVAASQWDTGLKANKSFFNGAGSHLKKAGTIYFSQANYGAVDEIKRLARLAGFSMRMIGKQKAVENNDNNDPREFFVFELRRLRDVE